MSSGLQLASSPASDSILVRPRLYECVTIPLAKTPLASTNSPLLVNLLQTSVNNLQDALLSNPALRKSYLDILVATYTKHAEPSSQLLAQRPNPPDEAWLLTYLRERFPSIVLVGNSPNKELGRAKREVPSEIRVVHSLGVAWKAAINGTTSSGLSDRIYETPALLGAMVVVAIGHEMAHHVLQDFWAGSVHDLGTWSAHDIGAGINWEKEVLGGMLCGAWAQGRHGRFHCLEDLFWEHRTQPEMLRILDPDTAATLLCLDGSTTVPVVDVLALHPRSFNHLQIDHEAQDRVPASLSALGKVPVAVIPRVRRPLRELELVGIGGCKE